MIGLSEIFLNVWFENEGIKISQDIFWYLLQSRGLITIPQWGCRTGIKEWQFTWQEDAIFSNIHGTDHYECFIYDCFHCFYCIFNFFVNFCSVCFVKSCCFQCDKKSCSISCVYLQVLQLQRHHGWMAFYTRNHFEKIFIRRIKSIWFFGCFQNGHGGSSKDCEAAYFSLYFSHQHVTHWNVDFDFELFLRYPPFVILSFWKSSNFLIFVWFEHLVLQIDYN